MSVRELPIDQLVTDAGLQLRCKIDQEHIDSLAEAYAAEKPNQQVDKIPPVRVLFDSKTHWLWDGNHRVLARAKAGFDTIEAYVEKGTYRDAVLKAAGANNRHGLRRTNRDKRLAVRSLLQDAKWGKRSDRWIAETCKVSRGLVAEVRAELAEETRRADAGREMGERIREQDQVAKLPRDPASGGRQPDGETVAESEPDEGRIGRDGKTYRGNGRQTAQDAPESTPDADPDEDSDGQSAFSAATARAEAVLFGRLQDLYSGHLHRRVSLNKTELAFVQDVLDGRVPLKAGSAAEDQALQILGLYRPDLPEPAGVVYGEAERIAGDKLRQRLVEWMQKQLANIDDLTWQVISRQLAGLAEECRDWETTP